jgi:hypothetical protein
MTSFKSCTLIKSILFRWQGRVRLQLKSTAAIQWLHSVSWRTCVLQLYRLTRNFHWFLLRLGVSFLFLFLNIGYVLLYATFIVLDLSLFLVTFFTGIIIHDSFNDVFAFHVVEWLIDWSTINGWSVIDSLGVKLASIFKIFTIFSNHHAWSKTAN